MAILFDTLKLADRLEAAGMPPRQAHDMASALAETITGDLVSREHFDLRLSEMETRLRGEIAAVRTEIAAVRTEISELRGEMRAGDERLRGEIRDLHSRLVWWIIGTGAAAVLAIGGLLRLLH